MRRTSQSTNFAEQYRRAGATAEVHVLNHAPHAFWNYLPWFAAFFLAVQQEKHLKS
jgi:acetyl esterase/lipase